MMMSQSIEVRGIVFPQTFRNQNCVGLARIEKFESPAAKAAVCLRLTAGLKCSAKASPFKATDSEFFRTL